MDNENSYLSEERAGFAAPALDLITSAALIALSIWVMIESVQMRAPDGIASAPGLLPFLTAATLAMMCLVVAWQAIRRRHLGWFAGAGFAAIDWPRTVFIVAVVFIYIVALQLFAFEHSFLIGGRRFAIGSFELVSPIVMTALLIVFWRRPVAVCFGLSAIYILVLSQTFRQLFEIPLWS